MSKRTQVARPFSAEASLKRALRNHLRTLGFAKNNEGKLVLPEGGKETVKILHRSQRRERLSAAQKFLDKKLAKNLQHFASGDELEPSRIALRLIPVKTGSRDADLFRLATLTWSVPVSPGFGRRMRYLVWDDGHDKLAGVIALGDPVYNLSVRDKEIDWTIHDRSKRLVGILDA